MTRTIPGLTSVVRCLRALLASAPFDLRSLWDVA